MKIPLSEQLVGDRPIDLSEDVTATVLSIIEDGWSHASHSVTSDTGEVLITEYLREGMRRVVETGHLGIPLRVTVIVSPGSESRSGESVMVPDGVTDIPMLFVGLRATNGVHDPHAIIECKRISLEDRHLRRRYVVDGIDRFRAGKYARNHAVGFMVGYIVSGDTHRVVGSVNSYLQRTSREEETLRLSGILRPSRFWSSRHIRSSPLIPIDIFHSFFRLRTSQN